eukprot:gene17119-18843_t
MRDNGGMTFIWGRKCIVAKFWGVFFVGYDVKSVVVDRMEDIQVEYKEVRTSVSWAPDTGMRGLKRKIAKVIVKDADVRFVLKDARGQMLREIRADVVVYVEEGREGRKGERSGQEK